MVAEANPGAPVMTHGYGIGVRKIGAYALALVSSNMARNLHSVRGSSRQTCFIAGGYT